MRTLIALLVLGLAAPCLAQPAGTPPTPSAKSSVELPQYTPEQRWARAASQVGWLFAAAIQTGKQAGRTLEQTANEFVAVFSPGWNKTMGPAQMVRAVRRNILLWPKAQVEVLDSSENTAKIRFNRPWVEDFNPDSKVTPEELERVLELFQRALAEERGMTLETQRDGEFTIWTIRKKTIT